jgi:predicted transcriptional regulator
MSKKKKRESAGRIGRMPRTTVSFPAETHEELERIAGSKKVSVAWVVREAVDKYLSAESPLFHKTQ